MSNEQTPGRQPYHPPELRSLGTLTQLTQQPPPDDICEIIPAYCNEIPLPGSGREDL
ncbi:MAG: hypothetical protein ACT4PM_10180 [Gemmatimonadales bacterium]